MTDKELRKLRRDELIEILYYMRQEIDDLRAENERLESRIDRLIGKAIGEQEDPNVTAEDNSLKEDGEQQAHGE